MKPLSDGELMEILRGVSRSFILTIRALPQGLRRPVAVAYLLARASDTMADTAAAPVEARVQCLRGFMAGLLGQGNGLIPGLADIYPDLEPEQYLLKNLDRVIAALDALPEADRREIVSLMENITHGQEIDLLKFPDAIIVRALETAEELEEYTYLVAGCVGEFWTRICTAHLPQYGRLDLDDLCRLGRRFGQGLQLVNILRDLPEDIRNGRCYLPMAELRQAGIADPQDLRDHLQLAGSVFEHWRQQALGYHEDGRQYIQEIRPLRIRFACLLPWALGVRTLKLMAERSPLEQRERIKVDRKEVGRIMRRALWGAMSNSAVKHWVA